MKRIANLAMIAILAGCGSDSSGPIVQPIAKFTGTWSGSAYYPPYSADTLRFTVVGLEGGGSVSGSVNYQAPYADTFTFSGTSTSTAMNFASDGNGSVSYAGTFVTSDSIEGTILYAEFGSGPLSLKKISGAPGGEFSGVWSAVDSTLSTPPLHYVLNPSQTGSTVTGSAIVSIDGPTNHQGQFTGTATPSTVSFKWLGSGTLLRYTGTYVTDDSIAGNLKINGVDDIVLSLKRN